METTFIPAGGSVSIALAPDLVQPDFGYDFAHDVTLRGLDGGWVAIAVPTQSGIGWFRREPEADVATGQLVADDTVVVGFPRGVETESIHRFGDRGVVLLEIGADTFVVRDEQERDMYCQGENDPPFDHFRRSGCPGERLMILTVA